METCLTMAEYTLGIDPGQRFTGLALVEPVTGKLPRIVKTAVVVRNDADDPVEWCRWTEHHTSLFCRPQVKKASIEVFHWMGARSVSRHSFEVAGLVRWLERAFEQWGIPFVEVRKQEANAALGLKGKCSDARIKRAFRAMFGDELDSPHKRDAVLVAMAGGRR